MSFSTNVKNELCQIRTDLAEAEAESHGMLALCRNFSFDKILLQTGNKAVAERFCTLIRHGFDVITAVKTGGATRPTYTVEIASLADRKRILNRLGYKPGKEAFVDFAKVKTEGNVKAFIRGAFLAGGTVSDPEKEYRCDFVFKENETAADFITLLDTKGFEFSMTYRAGRFLVYTKNSTSIEELLTYIGAGTETLTLIETKVVKSVRNRLNRQNNCETSNILKTANAAFLQTEAIKKIANAKRLETLPEELLEAANLRLNNPELSLSALCKLSKTPITRSGLNHRLKKLLEIAEEIK